ncbi:MAG: dTDP-4-amino-4,6-dideoxygalactose transaminase [Vicingaceae bacterium]
MSQYKTLFTKPYLSGKEKEYISKALDKKQLSGNGTYTKKCQNFFEERYKIKKALLTTSCTDALEMASLLLEIKPGDEVIMPSYTFVSTANAFVLRGAKIIFCDSRADHPGMDEDKIEDLITAKTKAIIPVHYAGMACDMEKIMSLAEKHSLFVVEDAAQAIENYYTFSNGEKKALGSIGHLATFSFHETKNISCGEGGLLAINDERFISRAEILWEKGTNRASFYRGEVNKYGWVDLGSSFLPSEYTAAFLWAQLEELEDIQRKRIELWNFYHQKLSQKEIFFQMPTLVPYSGNNAHIYYIIMNSLAHRDKLIESFKEQHILAVFHYQSLHKSKYFLSQKGEQVSLPNCERYSDQLLRLPLFYDLTEGEQLRIIEVLLKESN